jgi:tetratricopeptide (TPR) repeat protein
MKYKTHYTWVRQKLTLLIFGILFFLVLLETGLRLGGFIILSVQKHRNKISLRQKGTYRILCIGDTATFSGNADDSYPRKLETILNQSSRGLAFSVVNKGIPAVDSSYIVLQLEDNLIIHRPDMVIVMMGINDGIAGVSYMESAFSKAGSPLESLKVYQLLKLLVMHIRAGFLGARQAPVLETQELMVRPGQKSPGQMYSRNDMAYVELGQYYIKNGKYALAEAVLKEALAQNDRNYWAYLRLGECYGTQEKYTHAQEMLKKAIELNPGNSSVYLELGEYYSRQRKFNEAEAIFKQAIEINPWDDRGYGSLAVLYKERGVPFFSQKYFKKANVLRSRFPNPVTQKNYLAMWDMLRPKGIRLVCMQYPMRSVEPLKKIFGSVPGVILVGNERIFKDALRHARYDQYFVDSFAGDFGHCTSLGNRLLAESIAAVILKECFKK